MSRARDLALAHPWKVPCCAAGSPPERVTLRTVRAATIIEVDPRTGAGGGTATARTLSPTRVNHRPGISEWSKEQT